MIRQSIFARLLLALMLVVAGNAARACSLDVDTIGSQAWTGGKGRGYDVFDATSYVQILTFRIKSLDGDCNFYATVSASQSAASGGVLTGPSGTLNYALFRDATATQELRPSLAATSSDALKGVVSDGKSTDFQIAYVVPSQQIVAAGTYSGQIGLSFYEGDFGAGIQRADIQVPITVTVDSVAEVSFESDAFGPFTGTFHVNFGVLHDCDAKTLQIRTRGNIHRRHTISSKNGGLMRNNDPRDDSVLPYTLTIDGVPVPLGKGNADIIAEDMSADAAGRVHRVVFQINTPCDATAGDYSDTLSLDVVGAP